LDLRGGNLWEDEANYLARNFIIINLVQYSQDNQIKSVDLVRISSTHVKTKATNTGFRQGDRNEEATWKM